MEGPPKRNERRKALSAADEIARESLAKTGNGNRMSPSSEKPGGAEKGGPGLDKAKDRQPPEADRARTENRSERRQE